MLSVLFKAIQSISSDNKTATSFLNMAGTLKESVYAATDTFRSAQTWGQWLQGGAALAMSGVNALAYGLNALIALDKACDGALGVRNHSGVVEGAANLSQTGFRFAERQSGASRFFWREAVCPGCAIRQP
ncbi:MAG: hypothetical protein JHC61_06085 [Burkholderiaceae bacterium]|nr:hypothetical protein [Burkholderiaceae bacterium]